jgi:hypothetical protein
MTSKRAPTIAGERQVRIRGPHAGQELIIDSTARHRVVRCGRRFGKSTLGEILMCREAGKDDRRYIGLFTPRYKLLDEIWMQLRTRLSPIIVRANDADKRIELLNGTVIEGWTLENNPEAGRSRRYHLAVIDEASLIPGLRRWWDACLEPTLIDFAGRALMLGTPHSIGPDFDEFFDRAASGMDLDWKSFTASTFDNPTLPRVELERILRRRGEMPEWLWLREYMAIPPDSASGFFPRSLIKQHQAAYGVAPEVRGWIHPGFGDATSTDIILETRKAQSIRFRPDPRGPWRMWFDPRDERPRQDISWCMGIDIGAGVGAANTVISVGDASTGVKWAEYSAPGVVPEQAAVDAAAAGIWFGGRHKSAMIQFEINGPGEVFARRLIRLKYPRIANHMTEPGDIQDASPSDFGWRSSAQTKETLLSEYRGALHAGKFTNPSIDALSECLTYSYDRSGRLVSVGAAEDSMDDARVPHGDRVIADALLHNAMSMVPPVNAKQPDPPKDTLGWRMVQAQRAREAENRLTY